LYALFVSLSSPVVLGFLSVGRWFFIVLMASYLSLYDTYSMACQKSLTPELSTLKPLFREKRVQGFLSARPSAAGVASADAQRRCGSMGNQLARKGSGESRVAGWWRKWGVADEAEEREARASSAGWTRGRQRLAGFRGVPDFPPFPKRLGECTYLICQIKVAA